MIESVSRAALETLSIIAYRQPATRPLIDSIRGVNSEASVHTLVRYGLVEEAGRGEGPGRPILYSTTQDFLQHFGLRSLSDLPPLAPSGGGSEAPPDHARPPGKGGPARRGKQADPTRDDIRVDGRRIAGAAEAVWVVLNKPPGVVVSDRAQGDRPTGRALVGPPERRLARGRR